MSHVPAATLPPVNWAQPWLAPVRGAGLALVAGLAQAADVCSTASADEVRAEPSIADALNASPLACPVPCAVPCPVQFVPQHSLPHGEAYEAFIRRTGQVPTRDNLHDLFNGLVWQRFPRTKARLNVWQSAEIARQGVGAVRGPVRDAITVFDENGALLLAPPALWQALLARDWHALFVTHRPLWSQATLVLFGHALMEQLVLPRKNITAHVLVEQFASDFEDVAAVGHHLGAPDGLAALDAALAARLTPEWLAGKPFTPLPVLGVPGWWPANADPGFYADASVFRPKRPG
ncbi:MAG: DUF3025 domain-containing protein [Burkholderiales bacterium]|nr:DUF3025 domain-containing protein [Burkholderiales bacterium]